MAALSFVLDPADRVVANEANRSLLAPALVRALSLVVENRVVWSLMRGGGNVLTNEELNRSMARIQVLSDVAPAIDVLRTARAASDISLIGDRIYRQDQFDSDEAGDQRKAMNPHFLLAGGGGWFIEVEETKRRLSRGPTSSSTTHSLKTFH